jgi:hypothetical protein
MSVAAVRSEDCTRASWALPIAPTCCPTLCPTSLPADDSSHCSPPKPATATTTSAAPMRRRDRAYDVRRRGLVPRGAETGAAGTGRQLGAAGGGAA